MTDQDGRFERQVDEAWRGFRERLADAIAGLAPDEQVLAEVPDVEEDQFGASPNVRVLCWAEGTVRAEAASNEFLAVELDEADEAALLKIGWLAPTEDSPNYHLDVDQREADRVAWMVVETFRAVHAVPHPSFLECDGFVGAPEPEPVAPVAATYDPLVPVMPSGVDDLRRHLVDALASWLDLDAADVQIDADGDLPIRCGGSVLFVQPLTERPGVVIFAYLVLDPAHPDRLGPELALLNRRHPFAKFALDGHRVVMNALLLAAPFVPRQLHLMLDLMVDDIDEVAGALVERVGGRRFLDPAPVPQEDCPPMAGLLELMHDGRVTPAVVVELFDHDRVEILRMAVAVREGRRDLDDHDPDDVLVLLRRALALVVRQEARERRAEQRRLVGGPGQQLSLLDPDTVQGATRRRSGRSA